MICLGCGCACDDIVLRLEDGRIREAENACGLGRDWFGDGTVTAQALLSGKAVKLEAALEEAARLLGSGEGPRLVYLGGDLSCEAQREAIGLADRLRARVESLTSDRAAAGHLVGQRRGRATATLGEIRARADLVVYWGVDVAARYPRYEERYAPVTGRLHRVVAAVDIGNRRGPSAASMRVRLTEWEEVDALGLMRAVVLGHDVGDVGASFAEALELARRLKEAKYAALVHDGEAADSGRDTTRVEGLVALSQALNTPTRALLSTLRGGGNRSGTDAVLIWQTGFPFSVDFIRGYPSFRPEEDTASWLGSHSKATVLMAGTTRELSGEAVKALASARVVSIGPRASAAAFNAAVAIDTGIPGIHEAGTAYRLDDVPLPLRQAVNGPPGAAAVLRALHELVFQPTPRKGRR
jgi:formylmethanofuran dehydrogenase subunit B